MINEGRSLRSIQQMFKRIYFARNRRMYSSADLLLHVFEETALVAESFRKEDQQEIMPALAHFFGWLIAFANGQRIDLARAVFQKYQGLCPYCGRKRNCVCISIERKPKRWYRNPNGRMPCSLIDWQQMFNQIYGRVNRVAGREKCWLHVEEELGEISRAFRLGGRKALKEELADIFAWFIAFCNRSEINLAKIVFSVYPDKCDACGQRQCQCPKV